jgi:beta-mannosidase
VSTDCDPQRASSIAGPVAVARRLPLRERWQVCATAPGAFDAPPDIAALAWTPAGETLTAAAVERAAGRWSLDAPARRFDADDWWYRLRFDAPDEARAPGTRLHFDGLATLADAWLNGEPLLASDNMHVAHACEVGARLRASGNELAIRFRALDVALAQRRPRPRWRTPMVEHQQLRWFRTTLLGRTPGWSPPCAVVGPWRDVWLEPGGGLRATVEHLVAGVDGRDGRVAFGCAIEAGAQDAVAGATLVLARGAQRVVAALGPVDGRAGAWCGELVVPDAELWWPHTHGEPARYAATLIVHGAQGPLAQIALPAVGFRRIDVDTRDDGFRVRVNDVPVFCRGACWTPLDPVSLRGTPQQHADAIATVRAAGMNMLRVAGPMVYEDDAFFEACDAQGVLVWQDLMFANMDFPFDDPAFAASVETEVRQQLGRLRGRPSVAIVCGNSEVAQQAAMWGADRALWQPDAFHRAVPDWVAQALPGTAYWPSSALGGAFPHQVDAGTCSYYGVGAYRRPLDDARRAALRFATECLAFANVPGTAAIGRLAAGTAAGREPVGLRVTHPAWKARAPRDLGAGWDFEDVRDHYLAALYGVDPFRLRATEHERYLALSAAVTGDVMAAAFAEWRRREAGCGGALVWWLRDLWAGAGWGVLDERGAPKPCWHALAQALQPRTVLVTDEGTSGLRAHVHNDAPQPLRAWLELEVWRGPVAIARAARAVEVAAHDGLSLDCASLLDHFMDLNGAYGFGPLGHDATVLTLRPREDDATAASAAGDAAMAPADRAAPIARAFHLPRGPALPPDPQLGLVAHARTTAGGDLHVEVTAARLATGVRVEAPGWQADSAFFHLAPGERRAVRLRPLDGTRRDLVPRASVEAFNATAPVAIGLAR